MGEVWENTLVWRNGLDIGLLLTNFKYKNLRIINVNAIDKMVL